MRRHVARASALLFQASLVAGARPVRAQGTIRWYPAPGGVLPAGAIGAGPTAEQPLPLVCRAEHNGAIVPGELTAAGCAIATTSNGAVDRKSVV